MSLRLCVLVVACAATVGGAARPARAALARQRVGGTAPVASYSATLSSNAVIRQQQLICDPPEPTRGSTSVAYEPDKVTLTGFLYGPGYAPPGGENDEAFVEVGGIDGPFLQRVSSFLSDPAGPETGYIQVRYELIPGGAGQIAPDGIVLDDDPGRGAPGEGVDTHQLLFRELPNAPGPATYRVYADDGSRGFDPDFLEGLDDAGAPFRVEFRDIASATVTAPEPSGLAVLGLATLGLIRRRRG